MGRLGLGVCALRGPELGSVILPPTTHTAHGQSELQRSPILLYKRNSTRKLAISTVCFLFLIKFETAH